MKRGDLSEVRRKERKYVWRSEKDKRNGEQIGGVKTKGERDGKEFLFFLNKNGQERRAD